MLDDDLIVRAVRQLAAALARTTAAEVRAEGDVETQRADAALGRARGALARGDLRMALAEIDTAIGAATQLTPATALALDARSLGALAPLGGGKARLARLFALRSTVLRGCGRGEESVDATRIAEALAQR